MCRICGSNQHTRDCCPSPVEMGLSMPIEDFKDFMRKVWDVTEDIPYCIVRNFYSDWMNGKAVDVITYLKSCEA
jgi:hypothetical protein